MKTNQKKPRICIALPGINYLPYSPYVLSTLPMVPYLADDYDITVVYRKIVEPQGLDYKYLTLLDESQMSEKERQNKHGYHNPTDYVNLLKYQRVLEQFAAKHAEDFDLILEKEWPLLGAFSLAFAKYNVPTVLLAEAVYKFQKKSEPFWKGNVIRKALGLGLDRLRPQLRKGWTQKATGIVAETEQLKEFFIDHGYATKEKPIYPIPYGVDLEIFAPRDRQICREELGIQSDAFVLTYVGSLNRFIQEPGPIIEALGREKPKNVVLHIVGDGNKRHELEEIARKYNAPVIFHGRLPQEKAAVYIGASDICIAPYNRYLYADDKFTCASLKIPEYMACGRAVLTIPCERMEYLLDKQKYGFIVENEVDSYREFFRNLPSKTELEKMEATILNDLQNSTLKDKCIVLSWRDIAEMHKQVIQDCLAGKFSWSNSPKSADLVTQ
ncbi:MAG: glycosyltransferase [Phormidium sp.]